MDENFDHELVVYDSTENKLYTTIVNRRERLTSTSRFIMQLGSYFSFVACMWLVITTRDMWFVWGMIAFFVLSIVNAQVLNYRVILSMVGIRKEDPNNVDDLSDL